MFWEWSLLTFMSILSIFLFVKMFYFKSITTQTLSFEVYIYIILINDGSTDNSLNIIQKPKLDGYKKTSSVGTTLW